MKGPPDGQSAVRKSQKAGITANRADRNLLDVFQGFQCFCISEIIGSARRPFIDDQIVDRRNMDFDSLNVDAQKPAIRLFKPET